VLESLNNRLNLQKSEKTKYVNQLKGLKGERLFDSYIRQLEDKSFIINDLTLNNEERIFQIDTLLIFNNTVYLYEVKNYYGNYYYKDDEISSELGFKVLNPLGQLNRSKTFLSHILLKMEMNLNIEANIVFIHPEFYLYSTPPEKPFIFPPQLPRHVSSLLSQEVTMDRRQLVLAEKLVEQHIENYRPDNLPIYEWKELKKGVYCKKCGSFKCSETRSFRTCRHCGFTEKINSAIVRTIEEFELLFPEETITTNKIYYWCNQVYNKKRIMRLLKTNYKSIGLKHMTYYVRKNE